MKKGVVKSKKIVKIVAGSAAVLVSVGLIQGGVHHLKQEYKEFVKDVEIPKLEISTTTPETEGATDSSLKPESAVIELDKNDKNMEFKEAYAKNVTTYLKMMHTELDDPTKLIGNYYSITNIGGIETSIMFNEDGSYYQTYKKGRKLEEATGTYSISNKTIVLDGQFVVVDGIEHKKLEKTQVYANALKNNRCLFGAKEKDGALEPVLTYTEIENEK